MIVKSNQHGNLFKCLMENTHLLIIELDKLAKSIGLEGLRM